MATCPTTINTNTVTVLEGLIVDTMTTGSGAESENEIRKNLLESTKE
jgi:hypothetical protein